MPVPNAQHNALLPSPQRATFGSGKLTLGGLQQIQIPPGNAPEDVFAAQQLLSCIAPSNPQEVKTVSQATPGQLIVLRRTGGVDALPLPGEQPGPQFSRSLLDCGQREQGADHIGIFRRAVLWRADFLPVVEADKSIPEVKIEDWPATAYRGTMVDMSEGPLLQVKEIERQIDLLARWKDESILLL